MKRLFVLITLFIISGYAAGQELEPRSYAALPSNLNAIALEAGVSNGNVVGDAALPIQNLDVTAYLGGLGYVHTFGIFGKLARVAVSAPFVSLSGNAQFKGRDTSAVRSGFGDTRIRFGINLIGSPALNRRQFSSYTQKTVVGISLVTSIPTGLYYPSKLINIGSNRWGFKPEIGVSQRIARIYLEAYAGVWFFTDNQEYLGRVLSQKPMGSFQGHACYYFKNQMWLSFDGNWFNGGETYINDVHNGPEFDNWRVGGTWSLPITKGQSLKLQFNKGAFAARGYNYTMYSLGYQFIFF